MPAELTERLVALFRWIDPGPGTSHLVSDISGWWRDPAVLAELGPALVAPYRAARPTVVLAPAVTGLLLGPLAATALGVGFVAAHKPGDGRLPAGPLTWAQSPPDYRGRRVDLGRTGPAPRPRRPGAGGGRLGAHRRAAPRPLRHLRRPGRRGAGHRRGGRRLPARRRGRPPDHRPDQRRGSARLT